MGYFVFIHILINNSGSNWIRPRSPREQRMIYRISFYLYNTISECDIFLDTLDVIINERSYRLY